MSLGDLVNRYPRSLAFLCVMVTAGVVLDIVQLVNG